jgi:rhodanese-related sulfurtransferase
MSSVTTIPAAPSEAALRHFQARLAFETDAADVGAAVAAGAVDFTVLDVRSRAAFAAGHVAGARSLPYAEIDDDAELPEGLIVVYCWGPGCNAAQHGAARVAALGRPVKEMLGGWETYVREGWPVQGGPIAAGAEPAEAHETEPRADRV